MNAPQVSAQSPAPDPLHLPPTIAASGDTSVPDAEARIDQLIRQFQTDVEFARQHLAENITRNAGYLVPAEQQNSLPPRARAVLAKYAVVDTLAIYYRDRTHRTFFCLMWIAFAAMFVLEVCSHVLPALVYPHVPWTRLTFLMYPFLWLAAWRLWKNAHDRHFQKKYHDYRALAEGLRVAFFWNLLDLPDALEDHYLRKQQGELEWIRRALAWWRVQDEKAMAEHTRTASELEASKKLVLTCWVTAQLEYFEKIAGPREDRRGKECRDKGKRLFWVSFGAAIAFALLQVFGLMFGLFRRDDASSGTDHTILHAVEALMIVGVSFVLAWAAIVVAVGEKMAYAEHTRQYAATSVLFRKFPKELAAGPPSEEEKDLFRTLGKEALQENGDWLLLHRDRPLEIIMP